MTLALAMYRVVLGCVSPLLPLWLNRRAKFGKEDPDRLNERFARNLPARPEEQLVWMHGASVGESLILLAIANQLQAQRPKLQVLLTSQTLTSANILARRLSADQRHQMAPLDTPGTAHRFIQHWAPDLVVVAEGDIWPNLLSAADEQGSALALVNARMTEKSLSGWSRFKSTARSLFSRFDLIIAANQMTADGLSALSGKAVASPGNLKAGLPPPPGDTEEETTLRETFLAGRKCVLAASTHNGEDELFLRAVRNLRAETCAIIAPRHPERADDIRRLLEDGGWTFAQRSKGETPDQTVRIYLADTLGEMGLWYALADTVFLGGASVPDVGGHNPIEPFGFGKPIISGPEHFNFADMFASLKSAGGLQIVDNESALAEMLMKTLADPGAYTLDEPARLAFLGQSNKAMDVTVRGLLDLLDAARTR